MTASIGVVGAGAWGTALAQMLASDGREVLLWAREAGLVDQINQERRNDLFLPSAQLAPSIRATSDFSALERLDVFEAGNAAWRHRQQSQTQAALDEPGRELFIQRAARAGLVLTARSDLTDAGGQLIGWQAGFERA